METPKWSFLGQAQPTWALVLGWLGVYLLMPFLFIVTRILDGWALAYAVWTYSAVVGVLSVVCAVRLRSWQLLSFALLVLGIYPVIVLMLGVNS